MSGNIDFVPDLDDRNVFREVCSDFFVCAGWPPTGATINIEGGEFYSADNAVIMGNGSEREGEPNKMCIRDRV